MAAGSSNPSGKNPSGKPSLSERAFERHDLRAELDQFEEALQSLKIIYEQYFSGILTMAPEKQHQEIKTLMRKLKKAPFKSSAMNYRMRALEQRYQTYNSYWQRVLREREEGTYAKDVYKANLREAQAEEEARSATRQGKAEKQMRDLFNAYKDAIEKQTGKAQTLDFKKFHQHLVQSAKELKKKTGNKKVSFSVVIQDGKVKLKAKCS